MSKRRASSPIENPITKKPSMSAIAAATAYTGGSIPVKDVQSRKTIRTVQTSSTQLKEPSKASILQPKSPNRQPINLKPYGPWERASTANLRPKPRTSTQLSPVRERPATTTSTPFQPGLTLSTHPLQTTTTTTANTSGIALTSLLLYPTSLSLLKPTTPSPFTFNLTPQLAPPLPENLSTTLYQQHVCSSPLLRPGKLPYLHLGHCPLPTKNLHFYLILPNAPGPPHAINTGHLSDQSLQTFVDEALIPALEDSDPGRRGCGSWLQALNESNFLPLKSRRKSSSQAPEPQTESIHCFHLEKIWSSILSSTSSSDDLAALLDGHVLIASSTPQSSVEWAAFQKSWNQCVDMRFVGRESRIKVEMLLELDLGIDEEVERDKLREWDGVRRVRR